MKNLIFATLTKNSEKCAESETFKIRDFPGFISGILPYFTGVRETDLLYRRLNLLYFIGIGEVLYFIGIGEVLYFIGIGEVLYFIGRL